MTDEPLRLAASKPTDTEQAHVFKEKLRAELSEVCAFMDEIRAAGFVPQFQIGINNATGRTVVVDVRLEKHF